MIAGLPVCHLSTKSSPSRQTTMLSDLIMSRIRLRERGGGVESNAHFEPLFVAHKNMRLICYSELKIRRHVLDLGVTTSLIINVVLE